MNVERTQHYDQPYFVTPHAVQRYQERVGPRHLSFSEVVDRVNRGLQDAGPSDGYPPNRTIAIGVRGEFVAVIEPPQEQFGPFPSVTTIWKWGVCPYLLRRKGGPRIGHRFYRWLTPRTHGSDSASGGPDA